MKTDVTILLDRSGSMVSKKEDVEGGFNQLIEDQKKVDGIAHFTLYQFDTEYECVYEDKTIKDVPPLTLIPRGMTALLDCLNRAISNTEERLAKLKKQPDKVLFIVITDGLENASKEVKREQVFTRITAAKEKKWDFVYLGADQDAIKEGGSMGFDVGSSMSYSGNQSRKAINSLSSSLCSYRASVDKKWSFDEDES